MNNLTWFWLLLLPAAQAEMLRDPFQPPAISCNTQADSPTGWRLKGTVGRADLRHGWVVTPQGLWLGLKPRQTLLAGRWQVLQIEARQLVLGEAASDSVCLSGEKNVLLHIGK